MKEERANSNTATSFKNKWENNTDCVFEITQDENSDIFNWILNRNGFLRSDDLKNYLSDKKNILDAGCGNGRITSLLRRYSPSESKIIGIDLVAAHVAAENMKDSFNTIFLQRDLLEDLKDLGTFDFIYCQEVLHHTNNPFEAFRNLTQLLTHKGEIAIYVYKKKAPIREFTDDYIRNKIAHLDYNSAYAVAEQITIFGKALSDLNIKIELPKLDILGIEAGIYDLQRFIYNHIFKCFWNDQITYKDNVVINYDWYHPEMCSRHTIDEIKKWFSDCDLEVLQFNVDPYGITARGRKLGCL